MIALFDGILYNDHIMKYYAISSILIKKGKLWVKVNT